MIAAEILTFRTEKWPFSIANGLDAMKQAIMSAEMAKFHHKLHAGSGPFFQRREIKHRSTADLHRSEGISFHHQLTETAHDWILNGLA
jgi:hypothetical protein